jgi:D-alanyl-lipoteichoic acid acyltransferase DltB (MBOAT superfamily)
MLFNSHVFIFAFLPVTLLVYYLLGRADRSVWARLWLVMASLFFYGWWNPSYLALILGSIAFNYGITYGITYGLTYGVTRGAGPPAVTERQRRLAMWVGVAGNLAVLGYFKYANFFVDSFGRLSGTSFELAPIVLPLAISFFTFQQIAYLVDACRKGRGEPNLLNYCIFVTFFPQLIAGPIVHHREMIPQFAREKTYRFELGNLEVGLAIFFMGLFKKVVLADGIAPLATPTFEAVARGGSPDVFAAWSAALAYTFQLYFDFSGYSDMAIGLGRMFGVKIPLNFDSPYKAASVIDFWRRWHMTLSRFLRDYLYIPLGGNRLGRARRYTNLMITMVLGGLWHGAGWTFLAWGVLHGLYLLVNHAWRALVDRLGWRVVSGPWTTWSARAATFLAVVLAWVFFRADSLDSALAMLSAMTGRNGAVWPEEGWAHAAKLGALLVGVWWAPSTQSIMRRFEPALVDLSSIPEGPRWLLWRPSRGWAVLMAVVTVWSLLGINQYSEFLYFQF